MEGSTQDSLVALAGIMRLIFLECGKASSEWVGNQLIQQAADVAGGFPAARVAHIALIAYFRCFASGAPAGGGKEHTFSISLLLIFAISIKTWWKNSQSIHEVAILRKL